MDKGKLEDKPDIINLHVLVGTDNNVYFFTSSDDHTLIPEKRALKPLKGKFVSYNDGKIKLSDGTVIG